MAGTWTTPLAAPFNIGQMVLLTDGSVLAQQAGTSLWWRLRPDRAGRYAQGEWRRTGPSPSAPVTCAAAVLSDGRVLIAGGRHSAAFPSDTVVYARSFDASTLSVSSASVAATTSFELPATTSPGVYLLSVISNGIASAEVPVAVARSPSPHRRSGSGASPGEPFDEEQLFLRDLSEVHLLIDFISGRADKSLAGLKDVTTQDASGNALQTISPQAVVEEICKISYPPAGPLAATAQQAAFMLVVKDRLNYLASPALGITVAFTAMFAGVALDLDEAQPRRRWWWRKKFHALPDESAKRRFFSARSAYPNLEAQARKFRRFHARLHATAILLVAFVAYANWDISVTGAVLKRITDSDNAFATTVADANTPSDAECADTTTTMSAAQRKGCVQLRTVRYRAQGSRADLKDLVGARWPVRPVAISVRLLGFGRPLTDGRTATDKRAEAEEAQRDAARAADLEGFTLDAINALNNIVIPMAFGGLGTIAGLMRSITTKLRESLLAPRDFVVARLVMYLGMSAGLSVGLFFADPVGGGGTAKATVNTITIGAAGLSFLAGFGAEAFFGFLEGLLARVFPTLQPTPLVTPTPTPIIPPR
ncbi:hypothetical protein [Phenylobacterium sp.]|jgi:hypothetical protein|uniref:hypothetical protein n=1 Tax=Phenylobacterium sp. TaxID=1871053 RepID=UPI002F4060AC